MCDRSDSWHNSWAVGRTGWHQATVNKHLIQHMNSLTDSRPKLNILVPLCGKSIDMKYLYDLGHTVIGVELVENPVREFFLENNLEFSKINLPRINGIAYVSSDGRLQIFCCNFYDFDRDCAGQMDAIWDRCSFSAVEVKDRRKYCDVMRSLMIPGCRYVVDVLDYDSNYRDIPPYAMSLDELQQHFGSEIKVVVLDHRYTKRSTYSGYGPWISQYILLLQRVI